MRQTVQMQKAMCKGLHWPNVEGEVPASYGGMFLEGGFPDGASGKEPPCQRRRTKRRQFSPWVGKIPWRRKRHPTPVFLPGKSHGQRGLVGYSPWGHKELDTTKVT